MESAIRSEQYWRKDQEHLAWNYLHGRLYTKKSLGLISTFNFISAVAFSKLCFDVHKLLGRCSETFALGSTNNSCII